MTSGWFHHLDVYLQDHVHIELVRPTSSLSDSSRSFMVTVDASMYSWFISLIRLWQQVDFIDILFILSVSSVQVVVPVNRTG